MTDREPDDIFSHPDLQPSPDGAEDIQTHELMADAGIVNTALLHGEIVGPDKIRLFVEALNRRWDAYRGHRVLVAGAIRGESDGELVTINLDQRLHGIFKGFATETVVDEAGVHPVLCYEFSDTADSDTRYYATTEVHLEFPDLISTQRLEALVAPLLDEIDAVINDERSESISFLLEQLREVSLHLDLDERDFDSVYGALAQYLNSVSSIAEATALTTVLKGVAYDKMTHESMPVSGPATLVDATFYVNQPVPGVPELSLLTTCVQRGHRPTVGQWIIPLDSMTSIREVGV